MQLVLASNAWSVLTLVRFACVRMASPIRSAKGRHTESLAPPARFNNPRPPYMKKYLPSLDELIPGVLIVVAGFLVWNIVGPTLTKLTAKIPLPK